MKRAFLPLDMRPMEAEPVDQLPKGDHYQYEPKYDGFRCIAFRDGETINLQSKNQKPLERYFPEVVAALGEIDAKRFVLDGELVIKDDFETLQLRLHPAAKRITMLSESHPAQLIVFDLLADATGRRDQEAFSERRAALEAFFKAAGRPDRVRLGKATRAFATAKKWLEQKDLEGVVAKRLDLPYQPGKRAMEKVKLWTTIDCVVGGVYREKQTGAVQSLLLGLYDDAGRLNYVGRCRVSKEVGDVETKIAPAKGGQGFTGRAPGGVSRWSGKSREPEPLDPVFVVEVSADHITGDYMRHGARFLRWREDKRPNDCTTDQIR